MLGVGLAGMLLFIFAMVSGVFLFYAVLVVFSC